jgi:hypothetical protein
VHLGPEQHVLRGRRITSEEEEFEAAVRSFLRSLTPGAPFMMAFMENSAGASATPFTGYVLVTRPYS